ncbi:MAG: hypothetical protein AVDCRST_MAG85-411, partial [uncultured Solirubrobacteraceae bacterium]
VDPPAPRGSVRPRPGVRPSRGRLRRARGRGHVGRPALREPGAAAGAAAGLGDTIAAAAAAGLACTWAAAGRVAAAYAGSVARSSAAPRHERQGDHGAGPGAGRDRLLPARPVDSRRGLRGHRAPRGQGVAGARDRGRARARRDHHRDPRHPLGASSRGRVRRRPRRHDHDERRRDLRGRARLLQRDHVRQRRAGRARWAAL